MNHCDECAHFCVYQCGGELLASCRLCDMDKYRNGKRCPHFKKEAVKRIGEDEIKAKLRKKRSKEG